MLADYIKRELSAQNSALGPAEGRLLDLLRDAYALEKLDRHGRGRTFRRRLMHLVALYELTILYPSAAEEHEELLYFTAYQVQSCIKNWEKRTGGNLVNVVPSFVNTIKSDLVYWQRRGFVRRNQRKTQLFALTKEGTLEADKRIDPLKAGLAPALTLLAKLDLHAQQRIGRMAESARIVRVDEIEIAYQLLKHVFEHDLADFHDFWMHLGLDIKKETKDYCNWSTAWIRALATKYAIHRLREQFGVARTAKLVNRRVTGYQCMYHPADQSIATDAKHEAAHWLHSEIGRSIDDCHPERSPPYGDEASLVCIGSYRALCQELLNLGCPLYRHGWFPYILDLGLVKAEDEKLIDKTGLNLREPEIQAGIWLLSAAYEDEHDRPCIASIEVERTDFQILDLTDRLDDFGLVKAVVDTDDTRRFFFGNWVLKRIAVEISSKGLDFELMLPPIWRTEADGCVTGSES